MSMRSRFLFVALSALLLGPAGAASLQPGSATLDFGGQSMHTTAPAKTLTITNTGGAPVTVASVTAVASFAVSHNCAVIAAGGACTASVTFTPANAGAISGALTVTSTDGTLSVPLAGLGELSLATHYYRSILRRNPDVAGKAFWDGDAARLSTLGADANETWYAMALQFYGSPEYAAFNRDDAGFVTDLYNTFFNRAPDAGGLQHWSGQILNGMPREVVLASFMFSPEFRQFTSGIFPSPASRAEVDVAMDFYRGLLVRLPDSAGFAHWVQAFRSAQCQGAAAVNAQVESISASFTTSQEYFLRNRTDAQYVGDLYNAFLRRGGDLGGVQFWIGELSSGKRTRNQVRRAFIDQPEFQARVAAIISQGCLSTAPGSFSFASDNAVGGPNAEAQVAIRRTGGSTGAFDLYYWTQGFGCANPGTAGPVRFADGDAANKTISVPMAGSGICTVFLNVPPAPAQLAQPVGTSITVVPMVPGCPLPSNVASASINGIGNPLLQMQRSGQTAFIPLPATSPGRASGAVIFGESAGGAYTPQPVTLELSISKCPGIIDTNTSGNFCNLRSTNGNYNSITFLSRAFQTINSNNASQYGYCWAGEGGQYYLNARWTYSSCAFGAQVCGFAIQYNDGPF